MSNDEKMEESAHGKSGESDHGEHKGFVSIVVDDENKKVHGEDWIVSALKAKLGIDPAKVFAEITPQGLVDLDDDAQITIHNDQRFMTHARSGGSS